MQYYPHESNLFQDEKITELFVKHGYEGLGLYYTILEKLAAQEKPIKTTVLKKQCHVGKKLERVWSYMEEIELISSKNEQTFSVRINSYIETFQKKREKVRNRVAQFRENQGDGKNVTRYCAECNATNGKCKCKSNKRDTTVSLGDGVQAAPGDPSSDDQISRLKVKKDGAGRMIKPTAELLAAYFVIKCGSAQQDAQSMGQEMFEYYGSKGWKVGKDSMTNWNLAASRWFRKNSPGGEYAPEEAEQAAPKSKSSFI